MNRREIRLQIARKVKLGELARAFNCELCYKLCKSDYTDLGTTMAHHAYGYDKPFDVWWLCARCNVILRGKKFHSGQVSREEARLYIQKVNSYLI